MRAVLGRNHSGGPPKTYWGALFSFTLVKCPYVGTVPFPPPRPRPMPEETRQASGSEVYALVNTSPQVPGARTRGGQTKSFLTQVAR